MKTFPLLCAAIAFFFAAATSSVQALTSGDFTYTATESEVTITSYTKTASGAVTIPGTIGGLPVTSIGDSAFDSCVNITQVAIPSSVNNIGVDVFKGCSILNTIAVDAGNSSFSSVSGVLFDKNQTALIRFPANSLVTTYAIPTSVTRISSSAFQSCTKLTDVKIPNGVTSIGNQAFNDCNGFSQILIPSSVTSIGDSAFYNCTYLSGVYFNGNAPTVGTSVFYSRMNSGNYYPTVYYSVEATNFGATFAGRPTELYAKPIITAQPVSAVYQGRSIQFSVSQTGANYIQWQKDGVNILGATSSNLYLNAPLTANNAGSYRVIVSNNMSTISSIATLTVTPAITVPLVSVISNLGTSAGFSVTAIGGEPYTYQWKKEGSDIVGAMTASLNFSNLLAADAGNYTVTVSNAAGSVTSSIAMLTVISPPTIATQPVSATVNQAASASFSVVAEGGAPYTYQWQKDGVDIAGATAATLSLSNVQTSDAASYTVAVTNALGSLTSNAAVLTVTVPIMIAAQPVSVTANLGTSASFNVTATGTTPTYQWKKAGVNITGATTATLSFGTLLTTDAGSYTVVVTNEAGSVTSSAAALTVISPPTIAMQPVTTRVNQAASASFSVVAAGGAPYTYQWQKDGVDIAGATAATLSLSNVQTSDAASYAVMVTNAAGSVTSAAAVLTVTVPPVITVQPASITANLGASASFGVTSTGTIPTYQWKKGGVNITGATTATLSFVTLLASEAGSYTVVVTNAAGSVTSNAATLTVITPPTIFTQPVSATANQAASASFSVTATGTAPTYQWQKDGVDLVGATAATLSLSNVQAANAGSYTVVVSNAAGTVTSSAATLTVIIPPVITTQPVSATANLGINVSFSITATGTSPTYQWKKAGVNITGATTATLSLSNVQAADAASYTVTVSNAASTVTSNAATLTVITPPAIFTQPVSATVTQAASASFSVTATGTTPTYQWKKDGTDVAGATSATLILSNVQAANAGSYTVTITNAAGSVTSSAATLTVTIPIVIIAQPVSVTANQGASASFSATVTGTSPTYQWKKAGVDIAGATTATLSLSNVQAADAASYTVTATNAAGTVTSNAVTLTVIITPVITNQPVSATVSQAASASFSVTATGTTPTYQWQKDGVDIAGATAATLSLSNVQAANAGSYTVIVSNEAGTVTSSAATFTVIVPPVITTQPVNATANLGASASLSVTTTGTSPTYQWKKAGVNIAGATTATLSFGSLLATDAGSYTVTATNAAGTVTSATVTLTVISPPTISTQPVSTRVNQAASASFSVVAAGGAPYTYQWKKDGVDIAGATAATLSLSNVQTSDAASYMVTVTNAAGSVTSNAAVLTVTVPILITAQPVSVTANLGTGTSFSVTATGTTPTYQWKKAGVNISGATTATLSFGTLLSTDAGSYTVVVTNAAGSVTSSTVALTVISPPTISVQPISVSANLGASASFSVAVTGGSPYSYQWRKDGADIAGATSATLSFATLLTTDAANYTVVITNAAGSVLSNTAILTVVVAPTIAAQPVSLNVRQGASATFNVTAAIGGTYTYQWKKAGVNIAGATTATLSLSNVQLTDAGAYSVTISNVMGSVTSSAAILTVTDPPVIIDQPTSVIANPGEGAVLSVAATGGTPTYQWKRNGVVVAGATQADLNFSAIQPVHVGSYKVVVSNAAGSVTSATVSLTLNTVFTQSQYDVIADAARAEIIDSPNAHGLYSLNQVQALNVGTPLLARDAVSGKFKLTVKAKKSKDLKTYTDLPFSAGDAVINGNGEMEFQFASPDNAAFFRIESR